ncbi:synaptonemal complex protein 1-like [Saccostrea cucullata]|uniref:synaptonemal complex protein 1-like n=1 Tax=Saccostrea cuccullata TaxID=36930 RepID=UPI002ED0CF3E
MERGAQEAVPRVTASSRKNFQVRFLLNKIFIDYKDKQYIKKKSITELGTKFLENGVLNFEPIEWNLLKNKTRIEIFSKLLNDPSSVDETFKTRDVCMDWVKGISHIDYREFLEKEIEFVLSCLCDTKSAFRVSEKWCQENNFKTEDNPDVTETICKAVGWTDKNSLVSDIKYELERRAEKYWTYQGDWVTATLKVSEEIMFNPVLFDLCATKFNKKISVIANMTCTGSRDIPVICECRIYPKTDLQRDTSNLTFIRRNYEKYVYAVEEIASIDLSRLLDSLDKLLGTNDVKKKETRLEIGRISKEVKDCLKQMETKHCKLMSDNDDVHESLQKLVINNNKVIEEKEGLLLQLKSKSQKQVDEVTELQKNVQKLTLENEKLKNTEIVSLEKEIKSLRQQIKKLTTQNTNLKSKLEMYEEEIEEQKRKEKEQDDKLAQQDVKLAQQDEKIAKQDKKIAQQSDEIRAQSNMIKNQGERISNLEHKIGRSSSSSSTRQIEVKSTSSGSVKSVPHK